jgi:hypothetical protein
LKAMQMSAATCHAMPAVLLLLRTAAGQWLLF